MPRDAYDQINDMLERAIELIYAAYERGDISAAQRDREIREAERDARAELREAEGYRYA